jgi:hypothetical protein
MSYVSLADVAVSSEWTTPFLAEYSTMACFIAGWLCP